MVFDEYRSFDVDLRACVRALDRSFIPSVVYFTAVDRQFLFL
jgi:hypothetical protein